MCNNIDDVLTIPNVSYSMMYHNIISKSYTEISMHMMSQCLIEKHSQTWNVWYT